MENYDYGSRSPSPPPADGHTHQLHNASISDIFLHLRRRANSGPVDGHSCQRQQQQQQQQQFNMISMNHLIPPIRKQDGTTSEFMIMVVSGMPNGHRHRVNTTTSPYCRTERQGRSNRGRRRSRGPYDNTDEESSNVVSPVQMLSPGNRLDDDGFYQDFLEDVTHEARSWPESRRSFWSTHTSMMQPGSGGGWMGDGVTGRRLLPRSSVGTGSELECTTDNLFSRL